MALGDSVHRSYSKPSLSLAPPLSHWVPGHQLYPSIPGTLNWTLRSPFQALEAVNKRLRELYPDSEDIFDIVLMTNNHAQVGVRLINSINHYGRHEGDDHGMPLPQTPPGGRPHFCKVRLGQALQTATLTKPSDVLLTWH